MQLPAGDRQPRKFVKGETAPCASWGESAFASTGKLEKQCLFNAFLGAEFVRREVSHMTVVGGPNVCSLDDSPSYQVVCCAWHRPTLSGLSMRSITRLHRNKGQVAMSSNLTQPPHSNMVQGALTFKPRKRTLYRSPLGIQSLPLWRLLLIAHFSEKLLVGFVYLDNRIGSILLSYQLEQRPTGIPLVGYDVPRTNAGTKVPLRKPSLRKQVGCPLRIMDIASTDIGRDRQFVFAVHQQMQFIPVGEFLPTMRALFDRPPGFSVGLDGFATVAPSLQRRTIQRNPFTESRQFGVVSSHQRARDILEPSKGSEFCQLCEEPAERGLVRNSIRDVYTASLGNKGVPFKFTDECSSRFKTKNVLDNKTSPEGFYRMPFGSTTKRTSESSQKRRFIGGR